MAAPIRFCFDLLSPYAYLAWKELPPIATRHGRVVEPVPVLLAALLQAHGTKGPAEVPAKRAYVFKDALRSAHALGWPIAPPPAHPFNPLLAARCISLVDDVAARAALVERLFDAVWGGGPGVEDGAVVAAAASACGLDGDALVARAGADDAKARLRAQTEQALRDGAFGVPTMFVDGELFWGLDSLGHVERRLRGEDPVDRTDFAQWRDLPATARRAGT